MGDKQTSGKILQFYIYFIVQNITKLKQGLGRMTCNRPSIINQHSYYNKSMYSVE